jgi:uncharacterized protein
MTFSLRIPLSLLLVSCAGPPNAGRVRLPDRPVSAETESLACLGSRPVDGPSGVRNLADRPLSPCPSRHRTGFARDGYCAGGPDDLGAHVVCARVTTEFLNFSRAHGNDLVTPRGEFPGLRDGDRWREAEEAGVAPPVVLSATSAAALTIISRESLERRALAEVR